jgi:large subunit ribosomal protein L5
VARLKERYYNEIVPELKSSLGRDNVLSLPRLEKIVLNMGVGRGAEDDKITAAVAKDLEKVAGQKAILTKARRAISNFKLREGRPIGAKVTLRHERMYEFLDRLISVVIPRIRDFRGLSPEAFDGKGNYNMGLDDQYVFPEIQPDEIEELQGMNITIVVKNATDEEGRQLLRMFGMPFRQQ